MMIKKTYNISGFDCANCASNAERHLNKHKDVSNAVIDFNNEKLFITFKDTELNIDEIISIIHEVEEDEIIIQELTAVKKDKKEPLIEKDGIILLIRIAIIIALMVTAKILESTIYDPKSLLVIILYSIALLIGIYDVFYAVIKNIIHKVNPIDEHLLMTLSCLGAFSIALFPNVEETLFFDGVMVLTLFQIGELIEDIISHKSKNAIKKAIDLRANTANLIDGDDIKVVDPSTLKIDDLIIVKVGETIPVDGIIVKGNGSLDTSSLTGESMPLDVCEESKVLSGTILLSGSLTIKVEKTFQNSTVSKIMELIENSGEKKSSVDKFITRFARIYTPVILLIGVLFTLIYGLVTKDFSTALYCGVFILIIGCPCAIVISIPLAFFAGIGLASKNGIVIKGASHLDQLFKAKTLFIDKTGTLTYGKFELVKKKPLIDEKLFDEYLLASECLSNHPIARAVINNQDVSKYINNQKDYKEISGKGTSLNYLGHIIYAGNKSFLEEQRIKVDEVDEVGTIIYLSVDGKYIGYVVLNDVIKESSKEMVKRLNEAGIHIVLLSGDNEKSVKDVADKVGIKDYRSKCLPLDKTRYISEAINNRKHNEQVLFAGDGINDTPSMIEADVGVAMGGVGSDITISNADVIIMNDDPIKIAQSIDIAKKTRRVAIVNIVIALAVKLVAMTLTILSSKISFPPHLIPIFDALSDTGLTVLLVINSLLLIYRKVK